MKQGLIIPPSANSQQAAGGRGTLRPELPAWSSVAGTHHAPCVSAQGADPSLASITHYQ